MEQVLFLSAFAAVGIAFIWFCRRMERKRRIEIYMRMLKYLESGYPVVFCDMYRIITQDDMHTDTPLFNELLNESKKLRECRMRYLHDAIGHYWFQKEDVESRSIVLQNLINKLQKQKI